MACLPPLVRCTTFVLCHVPSHSTASCMWEAMPLAIHADIYHCTTRILSHAAHRAFYRALPLHLPHTTPLHRQAGKNDLSARWTGPHVRIIPGSVGSVPPPPHLLLTPRRPHRYNQAGTFTFARAASTVAEGDTCVAIRFCARAVYAFLRIKRLPSRLHWRFTGLDGRAAHRAACTPPTLHISCHLTAPRATAPYLSLRYLTPAPSPHTPALPQHCLTAATIHYLPVDA